MRALGRLLPVLPGPYSLVGVQQAIGERKKDMYTSSRKPLIMTFIAKSATTFLHNVDKFKSKKLAQPPGQRAEGRR
jgi:hypothetical protein